MFAVIERFEKFAYYLALGGGLVAMVLMLLTTVDVAGRHLFSHPVPGAYEVSEAILIPFLVYLSMAYGNHIHIQGVTPWLPQLLRRIVLRFTHVLSAAFVGLLCAGAGRGAVRAYEQNTQVLGAIEFPVWPSHVIVTAGLATLAIMRLLQAFKPADQLTSDDETPTEVPG